MPRRELELGEWGHISKTPHQVDSDGELRVVKSVRTGEPVQWRARTRIKDYDGIRRDVESWGGSSEAAEFALERKLKNRTAPNGADLTVRSTVQELADAYLAAAERRVESGEIKSSSLSIYRRMLNRHLLPKSRGLRINQLKYGLIVGILQAIDDEAGAGAAKTCKSVFSSMISMAMLHTDLTENPMPMRVTFKNKKKARRIPNTALTAAQEAELLRIVAEESDKIEAGLGILFKTMLGTGLRIGEACGMRWSCIDLDESLMYVTATMKYVPGEGLFLQEVPKTEKGDREIYLPDWLVEDLREYAKVWGEHEDDIVFRSARAGNWRDPSNTQKAMARLFEEAGVEGSSHMIRKTVATKLHRAGVPLVDIADQLGHADATLTLRTYIGRDKKAKRTNAVHL